MLGGKREFTCSTIATSARVCNSVLPSQVVIAAFCGFARNFMVYQFITVYHQFWECDLQRGYTPPSPAGRETLCQHHLVWGHHPWLLWLRWPWPCGSWLLDLDGPWVGFRASGMVWDGVGWKMRDHMGENLGISRYLNHFKTSMILRYID